MRFPKIATICPHELVSATTRMMSLKPFLSGSVGRFSHCGWQLVPRRWREYIHQQGVFLQWFICVFCASKEGLLGRQCRRKIGRHILYQGCIHVWIIPSPINAFVRVIVKCPFNALQIIAHNRADFGDNRSGSGSAPCISLAPFCSNTQLLFIYKH